MHTNLAEGWFFNSWSHRTRWVFVLPVALVAAFIASKLLSILILVLFLTLPSLGTLSVSFVIEIINSALLGGIFVYAGAMMAPEKQFATSVALFGIVSTLSSVLLFLASFAPGSTERSDLAFYLVSTIAAACYATVLVRSKLSK